MWKLSNSFENDSLCRMTLLYGAIYLCSSFVWKGKIVHVIGHGKSNYYLLKQVGVFMNSAWKSNILTKKQFSQVIKEIVKFIFVKLSTSLSQMLKPLICIC